MKNIPVIIRREYITRVRKTSFLVLSILGPLIFAAFLILPVWLARLEDKEVKTIAVIDSSNVFINSLPEKEYIKFHYLHDVNLNTLKNNFDELNYYAVLYIPHIVHYSPESVILYSNKDISLVVQSHITNSLENEIQRQKLRAAGIDENILHSTKTEINLKTIKWTKEGTEEESNAFLKAGIGYASGFLIYFFIFLFGAQVMKGVMEEKTGRIIEIIVSSVKPFQLMMGKIIGIAMVALTQFLIWVVLTLILLTIANFFMIDHTAFNLQNSLPASDILNSAPVSTQQLPKEESGLEILSVLESLQYVNFGVIISSFLFFFIGGYLLYGSLLAALGAAIDDESDMQQFMLPITLPLILGIFVLIHTIQNPESQLAFWFSIFPFTSPIVMMARIPFGIPYWEVALSMIILVISFIGTTWFAAKIYRTGILMYGKKITYGELWKWLKYKN